MLMRKFIAAVLLATPLAGCGLDTIHASSPTPAVAVSEEQVVEETVKTSMQDKLNLHPNEERVQVLKVMLVKEFGNEYQGIARLSVGSRQGEVPIDVTSDANNVVWHITSPEALVSLLRNDSPV